MFPRFALLLKSYRERANLAQEQLAEALGWHIDAVKRYENGYRWPVHCESVQELAEALGGFPRGTARVAAHLRVALRRLPTSEGAPAMNTSQRKPATEPAATPRRIERR